MIVAKYAIELSSAKTSYKDTIIHPNIYLDNIFILKFRKQKGVEIETYNNQPPIIYRKLFTQQIGVRTFIDVEA